MATLSQAHDKRSEREADPADDGAGEDFVLTARTLAVVVALGVLCWTAALAVFFTA